MVEGMMTENVYTDLTPNTEAKHKAVLQFPGPHMITENQLQ